MVFHQGVTNGHLAPAFGLGAAPTKEQRTGQHVGQVAPPQ
jgi:hypothetical protein